MKTMKKRKITNKIKVIFFSSLFIFTNLIYAHKNIHVTGNIGNVSYHFSTERYIEEINMGIIISKYTYLLTQKINYNKKINLIFQHSDIIYPKFENPSFTFNKDSLGLTIILKNNRYDINKVLKIVLYAITTNNKNEKTVDTNRLQNNKLIKEILKNKIYRPTKVRELNFKYNLISYFVRNNKVYLFYNKNNKEIIFKELSSLYQMFEINRNYYLIFTKKSEFFIFSYSNKCSTWYRLDQPFEEIKSVNPFLITSQLLSINISSITNKENLLIINLKKGIKFENVNYLFNNTSNNFKRICQ